MERPVAGPSRQKAAPFLSDGLFGRFEEPSPPLRTLGPGDSNYEMTFSIEDARADSDADWEKETGDFLEAEAPSSDEIEAIIPGRKESPSSGPWFHDFIVSWGRTLCLVVLGFVGVSVLVIGFLVASSLRVTGGLAIPASIQAMIVASLGTFALILIGAAMIFQSVVLAELVRTIHRMNDPENRLSRE